MNKKIIAIAIATAMAAPVAMADVKVSGRVGGNLTFLDKNATKAGAYDATKGAREFRDNGSASRMIFDGTSGKAYARIAYNDNNGKRDNQREIMAGYKLGGGTTVQFGRMPSAGKNIEKDPYITTFLESRNTYALVGTNKIYTSNGFVNGLLQYKGKVGANTVTVQYDPTDNFQTGQSGQIALALSGKAGAVRYWASYNTGSANNTGTDAKETNAKVGASMKMGNMKMTLSVSDTQATNKNKTTATTVWVDFGLGNGLSANVGYGGNGDAGTWSRIAINKKLNKQTRVFGGAVIKDPKNGTAYTTFGGGMIVKF